MCTPLETRCRRFSLPRLAPVEMFIHVAFVLSMCCHQGTTGLTGQVRAPTKKLPSPFVLVLPVHGHVDSVPDHMLNSALAEEVALELAAPRSSSSRSREPLNPARGKAEPLLAKPRRDSAPLRRGGHRPRL